MCCLCLLVFVGAAVTLSCAADVYEPLTAAAGLDAFSLHTTDGSEPLTDQETTLLKEKAVQARALAERYTAGAIAGLLLFSGSLLILVRVFFVSARLRSCDTGTQASELRVECSTAAETDATKSTEAIEPTQDVTKSTEATEHTQAEEPTQIETSDSELNATPIKG